MQHPHDSAQTRPFPDRPTLLLLHGFTGSPSSWDAIAPTLEHRYRIVRPYLPGHHPDDEDCTSFEEASAQVAIVLARLPAPRTLLGYSLGGRLALHTALNYPDVIEHLILESASPGIADDEERASRRRSDAQLAQDIRDRGLEWFVDYWASIPLFASQRRLPASVRAAQRAERLAHHPEGLARSLERMGAGMMQPMWSQLGNLRCPLRLITGELDIRYTGIARHIQSLVPQTAHHIIRDAGHTPHLEQPDLFLSAALR